MKVQGDWALAAGVTGVALLATGCSSGTTSGAATTASSTEKITLTVATFLCVAVWVYNAGAKRLAVLGPPLMGLCRGLSLLLYFGYLLANTCPEWDAYHDDVLVLPQQGEYVREPAQKDYAVCYQSAWQDFIADGIAKAALGVTTLNEVFGVLAVR